MSRRILHVTTFVHPDKFGGAERVVHDLACAQAARGDAVTIVSGDHGYSEPVTSIGGTDALGASGSVRIHRYPVPIGARGLRFHQAVQLGVLQTLREFAQDPQYPRFDVLHAHQVASAVPALRTSSQVATSKVFSFYAPWSEESQVERSAARRSIIQRAAHNAITRLQTLVHRRRDRACLREAERIIVLSEYSLRQIRSLFPSVLNQARVIPPGVDLKRFHPGDRSAARRRLGLSHDGPLIVTVRRLAHRMGIDLLIDAVAELHTSSRSPSGSPTLAIGSPTLAIAGVGPQEAQLKKRVAERGLTDRVRFLGRVEDADLPDLYRSADLFVLPTRALEGFGMSTLEAVASGAPTLGTDVGATPELLERLCPELPVAKPSVSSLAAAIGDAITRSDLKAVGLSGAARARSFFSWDSSAEKVEAVYDELVERASP